MNLEKYNQEQLLRFYDELSNFEKDKLKNQINSIDLDYVNTTYKDSFIDEEIDMSKISYLNITKEEDTSSDDITTGENIIKNNEYAVLLMAGGFGSRLGFDKPKGCLELNINNKTITLFELFINQIKEANKKYNSNIRLYIMTSTANNEDTVLFFEENNYFDYKEYIKIFTQEDFPILDLDGKILLKSKSEILMGPNGNGNVYESLKRNGLIEDMKNNNIKYVLFSTIDNPLLNIVDIPFIGTTINNNYSLATKTLMKTNEDSTDWIFCKYNNKPFILPSEYITNELTNTKINDDYVYRETNITYHLISIDNIEKFANIDLPYHRAYKNNKFLDQDGNLIDTDERNSYKFEHFIFDAFYYADDMLLYRIKENEFRPIKEKEDIEKTVKELQNKMS